MDTIVCTACMGQGDLLNCIWDERRGTDTCSTVCCYLCRGRGQILAPEVFIDEDEEDSA